eukprot:1963102-Pleurochrysis_carterae.AAC.1
MFGAQASGTATSSAPNLTRFCRTTSTCTASLRTFSRVRFLPPYSCEMRSYTHALCTHLHTPARMCARARRAHAHANTHTYYPHAQPARLFTCPTASCAAAGDMESNGKRVTRDGKE